MFKSVRVIKRFCNKCHYQLIVFVLVYHTLCLLRKRSLILFSREAATICPRPCKLTFDLESGIRVTCDVGYLCANVSLPRPLCSRLRPDVRDRQTSDAHHRLMPPTLGSRA